MARSLLCVRHLTRCFIGVIFNTQNNIASWAPSFLFKGLERLWSSHKVHAAYKGQKWWSKTGLSDSTTGSLSLSCVKVQVLVIRSCLTLCDPMDCSPPGSSVHGICQARILEWVPIPFSKGSSQPRDQTRVFCIAGRFLTVWAIHPMWLAAISTLYPHPHPLPCPTEIREPVWYSVDFKDWLCHVLAVVHWAK